MEEIWKDIPGYEGKYQASNMGRIKSLSRMIQGRNQFGHFEWKCAEKVLSPGRHDQYGHVSVVLNAPRKSYMVHQLVMLAFVGDVPEGMCILHTNGNAADNRLTNLRYDTQSENVLDVFRQGKAWKTLIVEDIEQIRFGLSCGFSCTELGRMYGVGHQAISKIKNGERYQWLK